MKVAIVHDYLTQYGGAEKVLEVFHDLFPEAPVYTSVYAPDAMPAHFHKWQIKTSFMQHLPFVRRRHQTGLLFYPAAFEGFDFNDFDLVLSSSSAWAKAVITGPATLHVCYCHAPMRFVWRYQEYLRGESVGPVTKLFLPLILSYVRVWDEVSAQRPDAFIANSCEVAQRIAKYYRREATVINPPVDLSQFYTADGYDDYFLVVARLVPYKRLDIVIEAFNRLGLKLKIVGHGRQRVELEKTAKPNIEFLGSVGQKELAQLYRRCKALVWAEEADFGIAPVEAQASGRPVIAYRAGGALETVVPGETGVFFDQQTADSLIATLLTFDPARFDAQKIRRHAEQFGTAVFKQRMLDFIDARLNEQQDRIEDRRHVLANGALNGKEASLPLVPGEPSRVQVRN